MGLERESLDIKKEQVAVLRERLAVLQQNTNGSTTELETIHQLEGAIADLDATFSASAQSINDNFFNAIEQGFNDIFNGAKKPLEALRDTALSVLKQIASMFLKAGLQQLLGGALGGGGGFGGAVMSAFGGFRAAGGDVSGSKAYVVGEKGPELIFPGVSGRVVSNCEMSAAMGSMVRRQVAAPGASLYQPREPAAPAGGDTNVHVQPKVFFPAGDALTAISKQPAFEHLIVAAAQKNIRRINSGR